jgi:methyl-accepting chemotaxis protein
MENYLEKVNKMNDQSIFVKVERQEEIQNIVKTIRNRTKDAKDKIQKIRELDREENKKVEEFDETIDHINANLDQIEGFINQ